MKKFWLIQVEGTPKAVERFDDLLDSLVVDVSFDDMPEKKALRGLASWSFPSWSELKKFIKGVMIDEPNAHLLFEGEDWEACAQRLQRHLGRRPAMRIYLDEKCRECEGRKVIVGTSVRARDPDCPRCSGVGLEPRELTQVGMPEFVPVYRMKEVKE